VTTPEKPDIFGWLGLRRVIDPSKARWLGPVLPVVMIVLFVMAVAVVGAVLAHALVGLRYDAPRIGFGTGGIAVAVIGAPFVIWRAIVAQKTVDVTEQGHITDRINKAVEGLGAEKEINWIGQSVNICHGAVNGSEAYSRTVIRRQGETVSLDNHETPEREGEWQVFTETQPNLEVRIGAIYALERIAQDSARDHVQIMEILCAYIRQNAPAPAEDDWPVLEMRESEDDGPLEPDWKERLRKFKDAQNTAKSGLRPREDIQVALTVIGRRSAEQRQIEAGPGRGEQGGFPFDIPCPEYDMSGEDHDPKTLSIYLDNLENWSVGLKSYDGYRLDLRNTDLRGTDVSRLNLAGARMDGAFLHGANLREAELQGANLLKARLPGARLSKARLQGAFLAGSWLQGAFFHETQLQVTNLFAALSQEAAFHDARLDRAELTGARLQGAYFNLAQLQGAKLEAARFQGVGFWGAHISATTDLSDATLNGAALGCLDLSDVPQITDHVAGMFGDGSVVLPKECNRPAHWPQERLPLPRFTKAWSKWQAESEGDTPPDDAG
jgi:uncharacterized protein YjbI with pentapeptide repeats